MVDLIVSPVKFLIIWTLSMVSVTLLEEIGFKEVIYLWLLNTFLGVIFALILNI